MQPALYSSLLPQKCYRDWPWIIHAESLFVPHLNEVGEEGLFELPIITCWFNVSEFAFSLTQVVIKALNGFYSDLPTRCIKSTQRALLSQIADITCSCLYNQWGLQDLRWKDGQLTWRNPFRAFLKIDVGRGYRTLSLNCKYRKFPSKFDVFPKELMDTWMLYLMGKSKLRILKYKETKISKPPWKMKWNVMLLLAVIISVDKLDKVSSKALGFRLHQYARDIEK